MNEKYLVLSIEHAFDDVPYDNDFETSDKDEALKVARRYFHRAISNCRNDVTVIVQRKSDAHHLYYKSTGH